MEKLNEYRAEIEKIDAEIIALLNRRCRVSRQIGAWKKSRGMAICDAAREKELLERLTRLNGELFPAGKLQEIYRLIFEVSRQIQEM